MSYLGVLSPQERAAAIELGYDPDDPAFEARLRRGQASFAAGVSSATRPISRIQTAGPGGGIQSQESAFPLSTGGGGAPPPRAPRRKAPRRRPPPLAAAGPGVIESLAAVPTWGWALGAVAVAVALSRLK